VPQALRPLVSCILSIVSYKIYSKSIVIEVRIMLYMGQFFFVETKIRVGTVLGFVHTDLPIELDSMKLKLFF